MRNAREEDGNSAACSLILTCKGYKIFSFQTAIGVRLVLAILDAGKEVVV